MRLAGSGGSFIGRKPPFIRKYFCFVISIYLYKFSVDLTPAVDARNEDSDIVPMEIMRKELLKKSSLLSSLHAEVRSHLSKFLKTWCFMLAPEKNSKAHHRKCLGLI